MKTTNTTNESWEVIVPTETKGANLSVNTEITGVVDNRGRIILTDVPDNWKRCDQPAVAPTGCGLYKNGKSPFAIKVKDQSASVLVLECISLFDASSHTRAVQLTGSTAELKEHFVSSWLWLALRDCKTELFYALMNILKDEGVEMTQGNSSSYIFVFDDGARVKAFVYGGSGLRVEVKHC